ncbi:MAG: DUF2155 domain-containing protein [Alphaproteobacteria bacterium]|uniref:DUF2155 domain-containing protein n=1 Tax=Candidatus Nitrobium versatile TaxID=2884831 RepID=A0A953JBX5_9BACT|nr:DUF2155 domain-containing protein [Candidatus Nitrobium versatile]
MKIVSGFLVATLALTLAATGCRKKEEQIVPKAPLQQSPMAVPLQEPMQAPMAASPHGTAPKVEKSVVVPDAVKGKWSKVTLILEDKETKKSSEYTITIKSDFKVPNTDLTINVGEFLPDFRMNESTLTSGSNEPNNPAVQVEVFEKGQSIFKGWLFAKFPTMHPLEHQKYSLLLKEGVKKS